VTAADMFDEDFIASQLAAGVPREELDRMARERDEELLSGPNPGLVPATPGRPARKGRRRTSCAGRMRGPWLTRTRELSGGVPTRQSGRLGEPARCRNDRPASGSWR
jgi:hypothetical protein